MGRKCVDTCSGSGLVGLRNNSLFNIYNSAKTQELCSTKVVKPLTARLSVPPNLHKVDIQRGKDTLYLLVV